MDRKVTIQTDVGKLTWEVNNLPTLMTVSSDADLNEMVTSAFAEMKEVARSLAVPLINKAFECEKRIKDTLALKNQNAIAIETARRKGFQNLIRK